MRVRVRGVRVRGIRVAGLASGAALAATWLAQQAAALGAGKPAGGPSLEGLVAAAICGGGALASAFLAVATVAAWAEAVITGTWRGRGLPRIAQRFLVAGVAASVALGSAGSAGAADAYPGWIAPSPAASATAEPSVAPTPGVEEGWEWSTPPPAEQPAVPTAVPAEVPAVVGEAAAPAAGPPHQAQALPAARGARAVTPPPSRTPAFPEAAREGVSAQAPGTGSAAAETEPLHVVKRGESLWRIAAARLGPGATDAEVAAAWPAIYAANRPIIGDDPGLIFPGQRLRIPAELAQ